MKELDARVGLVGQLLQSDVCALFYRLAQELPGEQVILNLGREKLLVCQDFGSLHRVLRENPGNFHKNFAAFTTYFGQSRLTADGEQWRQLQKVGQPLIAQVEGKEILRETRSCYGNAAERILEVADASPILTVDPFIDHAAASVVMATVLGVDISDISPEFYRSLRRVLNFCGEASMRVYDSTLRIENNEVAELESAYQKVRQTIGPFIVRAKAAGRGNENLERFYAAYTSDSDLFGEVSTLLFAGFDTTASTLCWALMLLANKPSLQRQLRTELREVSAGEGVSEELALNSPTLEALINETFRMFPPVPILSRIAVGEDLVGETRIESGQKVLLSIIGLHHDRNFWVEPSRLRIDRFSGGEMGSDLRRHFAPFSSGPRMCGGSKFALTELSVAIAVLLRDIQFDPVDQQPVRFQWGASMRHRDGVKLAVSRAA
ncbi:MAG: cytochrome P450 [Aestuariivirga sp.]